MRARMFQYKPDGEVTFRMAQDAQGLPAPVMQDPLHYPHNTGYMAPGVPPKRLLLAHGRWVHADGSAECRVS